MIQFRYELAPSCRDKHLRVWATSIDRFGNHRRPWPVGNHMNTRSPLGCEPFHFLFNAVIQLRQDRRDMSTSRCSHMPGGAVPSFTADEVSNDFRVYHPTGPRPSFQGAFEQHMPPSQRTSEAGASEVGCACAYSGWNTFHASPCSTRQKKTRLSPVQLEQLSGFLQR